MPGMDDFTRKIGEGYTFSGPTITLGAPLLNGECPPGVQVKVPLRTMNRHGLIAGATGTGKTKTLQVLAEQLSLHGVPSLLMDIKGDLSGIAAEGSPNAKIADRHALIQLPWTQKDYPVELLTISGQDGVRLRATVSEFGPVLSAKFLKSSAGTPARASIVTRRFACGASCG